VVAGGDGVEAELAGPDEEPIELEVAVALDAGVGRAAGRVRVDVGSDDVRVEVFGKIEDVVRDAELLRDAPRVLDVGDRATARITTAAPELHRRTDDLVALGE
jgi:hypothetical protein